MDEFNWLSEELRSAVQKKKENFPEATRVLRELGIRRKAVTQNVQHGKEEHMLLIQFKQERRTRFQTNLAALRSPDLTVQWVLTELSEMEGVPMKRKAFFNFLRDRFRRERAISAEASEEVWALVEPVRTNLPFA